MAFSQLAFGRRGNYLMSRNFHWGNSDEVQQQGGHGKSRSESHSQIARHLLSTSYLMKSVPSIEEEHCESDRPCVESVGPVGRISFFIEQEVVHPRAQTKSLRHGRWTPEEEAFACCIIRNFERGLLNIGPGTSLRNYLAERLNWYGIAYVKK